MLRCGGVPNTKIYQIQQIIDLSQKTIIFKIELNCHWLKDSFKNYKSFFPPSCKLNAAIFKFPPVIKYWQVIKEFTMSAGKTAFLYNLFSFACHKFETPHIRCKLCIQGLIGSINFDRKIIRDFVGI